MENRTIIEEIYETESWFLKKKSNGVEKPLARWTKIKRVKTPSTNIRNKIEDIATDPSATEMIPRECYEQFCAHKFENWEERHNFLVNNIPPKLKQEKK